MPNRFQPTRIFVVEDDPMYRKMVKYVMEMNPDHDVHVFESGKECLKNLHLKPEIISLDYSLPDMTGEEVLKALKKHDPRIGVIILSGQQDVSTAVSLLKFGAYDYITKDAETKDRLLNTVNHLKKNLSLEDEVETLKEELSEKFQFEKTLKGHSKPMKRVFTLMGKASQSNITVSITGETGTGKELAAKSIHYNSPRKKGPFIAVNMGAIPKELVESELFGHEKGAFTGATTRKIGQFEQAHKGTLFLDEIGEMELSLQAKVLRAIQEREIRRVGGSQLVKFDVRIIVATHRNLADEVQGGNFREDLYYRLLGLPVELPPLRERGNDILILAQHFLESAAKENGLGTLQLGRAAKDKLLQYSYPGNVRELRAIIELACVMAEGKTIQAEDINFNSPRRESTFLQSEMTLKDYNKQ
ncbi:MAG: sigma-54 dependent transcriptional regulator, partial [Bacteroidota bacterium]